MIATKGRKVGGRAGVESMTGSGPSYAFGSSAADDEIIIKHRLLTRATTTRGDPPFKKLQKKFGSFFAEIENEESENGTESRLAKAFLQELSTFEIPLLKSKAVVEANLREKVHFDDLNGEIEARILRARSEIDGLKAQLEESRAERRHKEECESVRKLIAAQPPRGRTQRAIAELESDIAALDAEDAAAARTLDLRRKQFALLLHVVDELQGTVEDHGKNGAEYVGGSDPMAVD